MIQREQNLQSDCALLLSDSFRFMLQFVSSVLSLKNQQDYVINCSHSNRFLTINVSLDLSIPCSVWDWTTEFQGPCLAETHRRAVSCVGNSRCQLHCSQIIKVSKRHFGILVCQNHSCVSIWRSSPAVQLVMDFQIGILICHIMACTAALNIQERSSIIFQPIMENHGLCLCINPGL